MSECIASRVSVQGSFAPEGDLDRASRPQKEQLRKRASTSQSGLMQLKSFKTVYDLSQNIERIIIWPYISILYASTLNMPGPT